MFIVRKHADKSAAAQGLRPGPGESWPLAGVTIRQEPELIRISTNFVETATAEGWMTAEGVRVVTRPAGPAHAPSAVNHTFVHCDTLIIHTLDEHDVRFTVTHQPDKYADHSQANDADSIEAFDADDDTEVTDDIYAAGATRVDWFYEMTREA